MDFVTYVAQKRAENTKKGVLKPTADAMERWNNRIVARGLHLLGEAGADQYLVDYGRGIAAPKCVALAVVCESTNYLAIADGFWKKAYELETGFQVPKSAPRTDYGRVPSGEMIPEEVAPTTSPFPPHLQPGRICTMQSVDAKYPRQNYIDDDRYLGQAKKDGRRMLAIGDGIEVYFQSRSTKKCGAPSIAIHNDLAALTKEIGPFILDGEAVCYSYDSSEHRTGAQAAITNMNAGHAYVQPIHAYAVFEALYSYGKDLTDRRKIERIDEANSLERVLHTMGLGRDIDVLVTYYTREGKAFLASDQKKNGREGEVWTLKDAPYVGGKDERYETTVRTKYFIDLKAVILGLTPTTAEGRPFGAIEIGIPEAGKIKPVGSVGTGYTVSEMWDIYHRFAAGGPVLINVKSQGLTENGQVWQGRYEGFAEEE